jgi:peptidoglycan/xylan/chitin deacetylase (PgdA/CDA1 family)
MVAKVQKKKKSAPAHSSVTAKEIKKAYRKKRIAIITAITVIYLVIVAAAAVIIDDRHIEITLSGDKDLLAEAGEEFVDPGAEAYFTGNLFGRTKTPVELLVESAVDPSRIGDYTIKYSAEAFGKSAESYRVVHVRDTTPPVITLRHEEGYLASWLVGYTEEGYTATDSFDGDLTDKVVRTAADDVITYSVVDSAGNESCVERVIEYGISEPMIRLVDGEEIEIGSSFSFTDPGYEATDESGNDLTSYVQVTGEVIPYELGTYELNYSIMNEQGETATAHRTVRIVPQTPVETVIPEEKTIYLTFDDGPGPYTEQLLNVLARYDAKATFFVTGSDPDYFDLIGRAYSEGHSIGVHCYCHDYNVVYASRDAYFRDFQAMEDIIYEQTGSYTKLFRFPGGSSNTVSRNYCYGIMSTLSKYMTDMGYVYFDWNVDSGDALGGAKSSYEVANNVAAGCSENTVNVVLQHDTKGFSVSAVETILRWGRNHGYVFKALDESSYGAHHGIAN